MDDYTTITADVSHSVAQWRLRTSITLEWHLLPRRLSRGQRRAGCGQMHLIHLMQVFEARAAASLCFGRALSQKKCHRCHALNVFAHLEVQYNV